MNAPDSGPRPLHGILRRIDLNLLVTLDTLLRERHVTRTAQVLNLAQPTVSMQLARLRELLDDPLLLPGPQGMQPTARAEQLRIPLHDALQALGQAVAPPEPFDPATAHHTWRLVATGPATRPAPASRAGTRHAPGHPPALAPAPVAARSAG